MLYTQTANGQEGRDVSERRAGHSRMSADTCKFFPTLIVNTTHSQMLGKFEYTGGPIFKVVLEC